MKHPNFVLWGMLIAISQFASATTAVFNVTVPSGTNECYIVGNFTTSFWAIENATKCTKLDATHFTVTLDESTFSSGVTLANLEYKYVNGLSWNFQEMDALGNTTSNRTYSGSSPQQDNVMTWMRISVPSLGSGTNSDPYQIATLDNLYWLSQNTGEWSKNFIQTANIDASSTSTWTNGFPPIGNQVQIGDQIYLVNFTGNYNGKGHSISGLYTTGNEGDRYFKGLFGILSGATVDSLNMVNIHIEGDANVGGLVGQATNGSTVRNCSVTGSIVAGGNNIGGLIGLNWNNCIIKNCHTNVSIGNINNYGASMGLLVGNNDYMSTISNSYAEGSVWGDAQIGGFAGSNSNSTIENCYAIANVSVGRFTVGGFVAKNSGYINNCHSSGTVTKRATLNYSNYVGGFVGENNGGNINRCYSLSSVMSTDSLGYVGGFAGLNFGATIDTCYSAGSVTLSGNNSYVGGFLGYEFYDARVGNCYTKSTITVLGNNSVVGGFVGHNDNTLCVIKNCYAAGSITASNSYTGGFIGENNDSIKSCFWDTQTTGITNGYAQNTKVFDATGKTSAEMKTQSTFTDAGWDFNSLWAIQTDTNTGYPFFGISTITGIVNPTINNQLSIFPNPATDFIFLSGTSSLKEISIIDIRGIQVLNLTSQNNYVDITPLNKGIYFVFSKDNQRIYKGKFLKK